MCKHNACIGWLVRVLQYESIMQYTAGGIFTWLNSYYILLSISPLIFWSRDQCTTCTCPWAPRIVPPTHWASFHSNTNSKHWRKSEIDYYPAADLWMCILRAFGCAVGISCSMYAVLMQLQMCVCVCRWFMLCIEMKQSVDPRASTGEQVMGLAMMSISNE